eukprot:6637278-Prymnesium_polylepis.1
MLCDCCRSSVICERSFSASSDAAKRARVRRGATSASAGQSCSPHRGSPGATRLVGSTLCARPTPRPTPSSRAPAAFGSRLRWGRCEAHLGSREMPSDSRAA